MTRKDYVKFAMAIRNLNEHDIHEYLGYPNVTSAYVEDAKRVIAELVAGVCSMDNYRFDWNRFEEACGVSLKVH